MAQLAKVYSAGIVFTGIDPLAVEKQRHRLSANSQTLIIRLGGSATSLGGTLRGSCGVACDFGHCLLPCQTAACLGSAMF